MRAYRSLAAALLAAALSAGLLGVAPASAAPVPPPPSSPNAPASGAKTGTQARQTTPTDSCSSVKKRIESTPVAERPTVASCSTTTAPRKTKPAAAGQARAAAADPADTNGTCQYARDNYDGSYFYTRTDQCYVGGKTVYYLDGKTGQVRGRSELDVTLLNYTTSGVSWSGQIKVVVYYADAIMRGTTLSMSPTCSGPCSASGGFSNRNIGTTNAVATATPTYTMTGFTNSVGSGTTAWTGTVTSPPGAVPPTQSADINGGNPTAMRCDQGGRGVTGSGCVYPAYVPTLVYSRSGNGQLGQHIADAQASGLPGAFGGTPLNRLNTSLDDSNDNRDAACPASFPRPTGLDCDEYPFASSKQGAASSGGTGGRTFSYCQIAALPQNVSGANGYSACMIDRTANRSGGGQLSAFYRSQRVLWDDAFYVDVDP